MEFSIKSGSPERQRTACVAVGVFEPRKLSLAGQMVDQAAQGYLADILRRGDMDGKTGTTRLLHNVPGVAAERVLLVGLGKEREFRDKAYRDAVGATVKALSDTGVAEAVLYLADLPVKRRDLSWTTEQAVLVAEEASYRFEQMKSKPGDAKKALRKLVLARTHDA